MHNSVSEQFRAFNEPIEDAVPYMYLDIKGLVTVGVGNLIDPIGEALSLPFRYKISASNKLSGQLATRDVISEEWTSLKNMKELSSKGHRACAKHTILELDNQAINELIKKRLLQIEALLKKQKYFNDFDNWPADAQLALLSMAWAMGPSDLPKWTVFCKACESGDFATAAKKCKIRETGNPGVIPRNKANVHLFENAASVIAGSGFYTAEKLYYPEYVMAPTYFVSMAPAYIRL